MNEPLTSKQWVEVVDRMRSIAKAIYNQNAFRSCALDDLADEVERLARAAAEPVAPSSPPADPDPKPSRADKLRAALKPAGVKVNVLGEADEPPAARDYSVMDVEDEYRKQQIANRDEVLCAGVVVSSPHDRRITLRFETDEQFRAAEVLIGIADCQVIDTAVTKEGSP